jgi:hypothetical protein
VKATVTFVLFQPFAFGAGVREPAITGAVLSIFTAGEENVEVLPARSVAVTAPATAAPSVVRDRGLATGIVLCIPERLSATVNGTDTLLLFHPAALGVGAGDPNVTAGGVLSMLMPETAAALLLLPALSVHVPEADWPAPSEASGTGAVHPAIPDRLSLPAKLTVTVVLFQPAALAAGAALPDAVGGVLSTLMPMTVYVAEFPATSWQVRATL